MSHAAMINEAKTWVVEGLASTQKLFVLGIPGRLNTDNVARGDAYVQLHHRYEWLSPYFFLYEREYDPEPYLKRMKDNNYFLPVVCAVSYLLFCYFGQKIMKDRKPFDLTWALAPWNLFLSLFSFYGASRTVPHMLWRMSHQSFEDTVCMSAHVAFGGGTCGLAVQLFILSKIPELFDTVFIVLRKKNLIFLHWYHHLTVLLYCWNSYVTESSAGLYFVAMNYSVHAIMYFYFFLQAVDGAFDKADKARADGASKKIDGPALVASEPKKAKKFSFTKLIFPYPQLITAFQISQMVVGVTVVVACFYFHFYGEKGKYKYKDGPKSCGNTESNLLAGGIMYGSYLYLFCEFAIKKFIFGIDDSDKLRGKASSGAEVSGFSSNSSSSKVVIGSSKTAAAATTTTTTTTSSSKGPFTVTASSSTETKSSSKGPAPNLEGLISPDDTASAPSPNPKQRASFSKK